MARAAIYARGSTSHDIRALVPTFAWDRQREELEP
jgi:hypothetical protein